MGLIRGSQSIAVTVCFMAVLLSAPGGTQDNEQAPTGPVFEDVSAAGGLTVPHRSSPEKRYIIESMSGGIGVVDYDGDGDLDIVAVNGSNVESYRHGGDLLVTLYRQDEPLSFVDVTEEAGLRRRGWGMGVAAADYDNDGWIDLYVTGYGGNALYRNKGEGTFEDVSEMAGVRASGFSTGAAWGDYDKDGWLDLFVARYVYVDINNLPEFGSAEFCRYKRVLVQCGPWGMPGEGDFLFHNKGDGTFEEVGKQAGVHDPEEFYGLGAVWTDFDDDGWLDLFVADDATPNYLYKNNGDGTFSDVALFSGVALSGEGVEQGCMGVDFGDYDRDGRLDLFVTNFSEQTNTLYRNLGEGGFADVSWSARLGPSSYPQVGWGTDFFDYDHDGWLDLFVANGHVYPQVDLVDVGTKYRQPMLLYRNNRDGTFTHVSEEAGLTKIPLASRRGSAFGDIDNDGDIDIVVLSVGEPPTLLLNRLKNDNHRVMFELKGRQVNRNAIGARLRLKAGELEQFDEVRGGSSYISQNDLRLHFGLGLEKEIEWVEVLWPSGKGERFRKLAAGKLYVIVEGQGIQEERRLDEPRAGTEAPAGKDRSISREKVEENLR